MKRRVVTSSCWWLAPCAAVTMSGYRGKRQPGQDSPGLRGRFCVSSHVRTPSQSSNGSRLWSSVALRLSGGAFSKPSPIWTSHESNCDQLRGTGTWAVRFHRAALVARIWRSLCVISRWSGGTACSNSTSSTCDQRPGQPGKRVDGEKACCPNVPVKEGSFCQHAGRIQMCSFMGKILKLVERVQNDWRMNVRPHFAGSCIRTVHAFTA